MTKKTKTIIEIIILGLIIIGLGAYFYFGYFQKEKPLVREESNSQNISKIATLKFIKEDLVPETKEKYQKAFDVQAQIFLNNPYGAEAFWALIKIEQIKQSVEDYQGAEQALLWAVELQPKSYLAHGNLANLYLHHFQDFPKAEEHLLKAVESGDPKTAFYYLDLHQLYRYFYKQDMSLAEDILKQGLVKHPQAVDLMAVLADYYRSLARNNEAKEYYQKMLEINPDSQVAKQGLEDLIQGQP